MRTFIETLTITQLSHIIPVIERGLALEEIEYIATKNPEGHARICDACVFLSLLYIRKMDINRSFGELPESGG